MAVNPIRARREQLGISQAELARRVGIDRQKMWKIETDRREIQPEEIPALQRELGLNLEQLLGQKPLRGFAESEAEYINEPDMTDLELRLARLLYPTGQADTLVVTTPALILNGYAIGDRILVDRKRQPSSGDNVVCQIYDEEIGWAETILRCYRPPLLMPAAVETHYRAYPEDDPNVRIVGVIVNSYQKPEVHAAA